MYNNNIYINIYYHQVQFTILILVGNAAGTIIRQLFRLKADMSWGIITCNSGLRTRRNLSPGYLGLEPRIVENWPNKG